MDIEQPFPVVASVDPLVNPDFQTSTAPPADDWSRRAGFAFIALLVWAVSVAFIAIIPAVFLLPYLASKNVSLTDTGQIIDFAKSDQNAVLIQLAAILPAHILTLIIAYVIVSHGRRFSFLKTLGWEKGGVRWWHYAVVLGGFLFVGALANSFFPEQENEMIRILQSSRYAVFVIAFIATFSAPLIEEVIYRGVLYSTFQRAFGMPAAFVLVTILFSLVHVPQYYPSYSTIFLLTLLSVTLTGMRVWSNNLLPCIILHTVFNGFQSVVFLLEPLIQNPEKAATAAGTVLK